MPGAEMIRILRGHTPNIQDIWMMRWSRLHGDMQGRRGAKEDAPSATAVRGGKTQAKFLVG
jgi:hypothetical protein